MISCTFEKGYKASLRHLTLGAIIVKDEKILLIKRADHLLEGGKYGIPGGFMDRDETAAEGIYRETLEETGYESKVTALFRINDNPNRPKEDRQNVEFVFLLEVGEKVTEPDDETAEVKWFPLDNLPPEDQFAFDHYENVQLYLKHRNHKEHLPLMFSTF